jgi:electron transport complex protein RnfE
LSGIELVFGPAAKSKVFHVVPEEYHYQFLLMVLPPGAFFGLAFLIASKNWINDRSQAKEKVSCSRTKP